MKSAIESTHPVTDAACEAATGKTMQQWYAELDAHGALQKGRRPATMYLYQDGKVPEWWMTTIAVEYEKHHGLKNKKDGLFEGYGICVTKTINAPLNKLEAAWTDPRLLSAWFGTGSKAKVEDGGTYENADGDRGKYLRVRPGKDLRFTWENAACSAPTLVDVVFADKGAGKSHVMLNHTRIQTRAEADGLRSGWGEAFDKLKALLEAA
jgi:uncharacterized protein YndB with AHSA1/START domain